MLVCKQLLASLSLLALLAVGSGAIANETASTFPPDQLEYFEKHVRPLLAEHCYSCHSTNSEKLQAGLLVDSRAAILAGGDSGAAIVVGSPDESLLLEAVRYESYEMPPQGKLPDEAIEVLERWVEMGAPWPRETAPSGASKVEVFDLHKRKAEHWVWQPVELPSIPEVADRQWPRSELDHFILQRLEAASLRPAEDTDPRALVRRLYFDLIGLPPTAEQVAAYLEDTSVDATARLIDQLLDSPHFGERWGRHWLDLVRYAESRGHEFDFDAPNAFQYRDYVIRALNADVPYDQFVREHIAGDLVEQPRLHPERGFNESILGTGFWFLGEWVQSPVDIRKEEFDRFDNMIDVMSKAFLGVTVSCARCHDHKFDAISTADYYSLTGFLESSDYRQVRFESLESNREVAKDLAELDEKYQREILAELAAMGYVPASATTWDEQSAKPVVVHLGELAPADCRQDGFIFGRGPRATGTPFLAEADGSWKLRLATHSVAVSDAFWDGLVAHSEKGYSQSDTLRPLPRSGRTLRTPTFTLESGKVDCRVRGSGHVVACVDSHRLVAGPLHGETVTEIKPGQTWVTLDLSRYVGHRLHLEFTPAEKQQLEISLVTQGASAEQLQQLETSNQHTVESIQAINQEVESLLAINSVESARLGGLVNSWGEARAELQKRVVRESHVAMAMLDGTGEDGHVLIRGNSSKPGNLEPRHFLTAVSGNQPLPIARGSGRLALAEQINDPSNPLTTRVIVNRIWHHLMGRGLVPTTDDFGVLGQRPTHPELLDYLATRFVDDGQSLKRMIRYLVLSRTYQMSSHADGAALEQDPKNLLWHYRPPKRLQGEAIRDALLAVSGQLDRKQFGEPVPIHLTSFMTGRGRPGESGPLDGARRRSIYIAVRRNFLSPFMLAFDTPAPFSAMGRRNVSNVPAQALILMNDPLVVEQSRHWAELAIEKNSSVEERILWMYLSAFARQPTTAEFAAAQQFVATQSAQQSEADVWTDFAHALINTKEFIFLR